MQQYHGPKIEKTKAKLYKCPSIKVPNNDDENNLQYDPHRIPPDIELAKKHKMAQAVGKIDKKELDHPNIQCRCPCCNLPFKKTQIPLTEPVKQLGFLGQGFPLYFDTITQYVIYLFFLFIISGLYNVIIIYIQCSQDDPMCHRFLGIWYMSGKSKKIFQTQNVLNLLGIIFSCIFAFSIRIRQKEIALETDESLTTPGDYTLLMEGSKQLTELEIKEFFQKKQKQQGKDVVLRFPGINRIIFTVRVDQYKDWENQIGRFKKEQEQIQISLTENIDETLEKITAEIQKLQNKLDYFLKNQDKERCRYIFITFNSEQEARKMIKNYQPKRCKIFKANEMISRFQEQRILKHYVVKLERAPEPFDIIWQNLHYSYKEQLIRRIKTIAVAIVTIIVGALIMYGLNKVANESNPGSDYGIAFLLSIPIQIENECLSKLLSNTIELQKHITYTNEARFNIYDLFDRWLTISVIITQFINTAIVPFVLYTISDKKNLAEAADNFLNGLFFFWLLDIIIVPSLLILDTNFLYKLIQRKEIEKQDSHHNYNQEDTHLIYEGPQFDISSNQAQINTSILVSIFYVNIFPFGLIMVLVTNVFVYWVTKYQLLRICSWPKPLSWELQDSIQKLMNFIPLILAIGGLCYEQSFNVQNIEVNNIAIHILNFCIGILAIFLIPNIPYKQKKVEIDVTINFDEAKPFFITDYDIENPISHKQARRYWLEKQQRFKQEQDQISEQNQLIKNQPQGKYLNIYDYPEQFENELRRTRYQISSWQQSRLSYQENPNQFIIQSKE